MYRALVESGLFGVGIGAKSIAPLCEESERHGRFGSRSSNVDGIRGARQDASVVASVVAVEDGVDGNKTGRENAIGSADDCANTWLGELTRKHDEKQDQGD